MSRLRELMEELCPDGVEYKKLGEIATNVFRGSGIKRDEVKEKGTPCVRYGEIYTTYGIWFDACISHTDETVVANPKYFEHGDILFAITGENVEEIAKSTAYIGYDKCLAGGDIVVLQHKQNPKYLSYVLSTEMAQRQKSKGRVKSKVVHSSVPAIKGIEIPVPPLEIQNEIVKLLDDFTELTAELTEQLMTELTLRKKQYNFYRDSLLNFVRVDDTIVQTDRQTDRQVQRISKFGLLRKTFDVEWKTLGEVSSQICSGGTPTASNATFYVGTIPWLRTQEIDWADIYDTGIKISEEALKASSARWIPANCVIVAMYGATAAKVAINRIPLTTNQACCNLKINEEMAEHRYVYYWLCSQYKTLKAKGQGSQSNINKSIIEKHPIPIPPLEVQQKIVSILDRFDALCNDLTSGLLAEIVARKRQYEHYRDKLLTFPRSKLEERS